MASWLDAPNPPLRVTAALQCALREGLLGEDNPSALLMDMSRIERTVSALQRALAEPHFLHTMAVKACPLTAVLRLARDSGCGAECASLGEVVLALSVGFAPHRVVFDSPCKTRAELAYCLDRGVTINADSLSELQRIDVLVRARGSTPASRIGVRVNPQVRHVAAQLPQRSCLPCARHDRLARAPSPPPPPPPPPPSSASRFPITGTRCWARWLRCRSSPWCTATWARRAAPPHSWCKACSVRLPFVRRSTPRWGGDKSRRWTLGAGCP